MMSDFGLLGVLLNAFLSKGSRTVFSVSIALLFLTVTVSCTKGQDSSVQKSPVSSPAVSNSVSPVMEQKAKGGFVPYENRPPFGQPVETH